MAQTAVVVVQWIILSPPLVVLAMSNVAQWNCVSASRAWTWCARSGDEVFSCELCTSTLLYCLLVAITSNKIDLRVSRGPAS